MNEIPDLSSQQAGRYMSDAEIDADRLALINFTIRFLGLRVDSRTRTAIAEDYKESLTRIAPKESEKSSSEK